MSNLFVIDAGNTNIVLGIFKDGKFLNQGRVETDREGSLEKYREDILTFLSANRMTPGDFEGAAISNVVPALENLLNKLTLDLFGKNPFHVRYDNKMNMSIKLHDPREMGADLMASAVAAIEKYGVPCIVIDFGTATTYAAIDREAKFLGGAISQGINVSCKGLYMHAPHLPRIELKNPPSVIGKDTVTAMQSGIYLGYTHMVRGIVSDMKKILGEDARVIGTGGLANILEHEENLLDVNDQGLVLEGIYYLYKIWKANTEDTHGS